MTKSTVLVSASRSKENIAQRWICGVSIVVCSVSDMHLPLSHHNRWSLLSIRLMFHLLGLMLFETWTQTLTRTQRPVLAAHNSLEDHSRPQNASSQTSQQSQSSDTHGFESKEEHTLHISYISPLTHAVLILMF
jgi:hypothetical protein